MEVGSNRQTEPQAGRSVNWGTVDNVELSHKFSTAEHCRW